MSRKCLFILLALCMQMPVWAQSSNDAVLREGVSRRQAKAAKKLSDDKKFYWTGKVPVEEGVVTFRKKIACGGQSPQAVTEVVGKFAENLVERSGRTNISQVTVADKEQGKVIASMAEEMVFKSRAWEKDVTEFYYLLTFDVQEGGVTVTINNISYKYEEGRESGGAYLKAEDWITDKVAFNKSKTKLLKEPAKFRRATIDRANAIFKEVEALF